MLCSNRATLCLPSWGRAALGDVTNSAITLCLNLELLTSSKILQTITTRAVVVIA
ncbi:MAG: hypothetical protein IJW72_01080 [Alphaproteobacteria bacterium]|nr:hypothetical protein [Alphaproteobacteria bacterium]